MTQAVNAGRERTLCRCSSNRKGKVYSRCDSQGHTRPGKKKPQLPGACEWALRAFSGCSLGKVWTSGLFSFSLGLIPTPHHTLQVYLAPSLPSAKTLSRKSSTPSAWQPLKACTFTLYSTINKCLVHCSAICGDTQVSHLFGSWRQRPVMTKSTDLEPRSWSQTLWAWIPFPSLCGYLTLSRSLNLSVFYVFICKTGILRHTSQDGKDWMNCYVYSSQCGLWEGTAIVSNVKVTSWVVLNQESSQEQYKGCL